LAAAREEKESAEAKVLKMKKEMQEEMERLKTQYIFKVRLLLSILSPTHIKLFCSNKRLGPLLGNPQYLHARLVSVRNPPFLAGIPPLLSAE